MLPASSPKRTFEGRAIFLLDCKPLTTAEFPVTRNSQLSVRTRSDMNLQSRDLVIPIEPLDFYRSDRNPTLSRKIDKFRPAHARHQIYHGITYRPLWLPPCAGSVIKKTSRGAIAIRHTEFRCPEAHFPTLVQHRRLDQDTRQMHVVRVY
jgi:hypothetical protein